jgi:hypothetical protein
MNKIFLSKVLKLVKSGLFALEKKHLTESTVCQFKIDIYNTLHENPEAFKMYMEYIKKIGKSKSLGRSSRKSLGRSSRKSLGRSSRKSSSKRSSKSSRSSRSKTLGRGRGHRTRKSGRSGRARGNSDDDNCDDSNTCNVCWNNITNSEPFISHNAGANCIHKFHRDCLTGTRGWWTADSSKTNTCPKCNVQLPNNAWTTDIHISREARETAVEEFDRRFPDGLINFSYEHLHELVNVVDQYENNITRLTPYQRHLYNTVNEHFIFGLEFRRILGRLQEQRNRRTQEERETQDARKGLFILIIILYLISLLIPRGID